MSRDHDELKRSLAAMKLMKLNTAVAVASILVTLASILVTVVAMRV